MNEVDLNTEIDRALQIYNTASPHIKKRESMRLLGLLAKALVQMQTERELAISALTQLLEYAEPRAEPMESLCGLISQIDHVIATRMQITVTRCDEIKGEA